MIAKVTFEKLLITNFRSSSKQVRPIILVLQPCYSLRIYPTNRLNAIATYENDLL